MRTNRMRAGDLRTPMLLGMPVYGQDATGARTITWQEAPVFCKIEPSFGREWLTNAMIKDQVDQAVTLRYAPSMVPDATWRLRDSNSGLIYSIILVMIHPKHHMIELGCKTMTGNPTDGR